ncbi:hypothetical protein LR013_06235 [candidate division NPL-UPA2 bacterium]|nr:hypothetical protein [candidate division NPL-UPA2 bacterium]
MGEFRVFIKPVIGRVARGYPGVCVEFPLEPKRSWKLKKRDGRLIDTKKGLQEYRVEEGDTFEWMPTMEEIEKILRAFLSEERGRRASENAEKLRDVLRRVGLI